MSNLPSYLDEYKEAGECFRRGFGLLFDIIKLFLTFSFVLGAIIAFIGKDNPLGEWQRLLRLLQPSEYFPDGGLGSFTTE